MYLGQGQPERALYLDACMRTRTLKLRRRSFENVRRRHGSQVLRSQTLTGRCGF